MIAPSLISLFSGAGGMDIGLERAGWDTLTATDIDRAAIDTLRANSGRVKIPGRSSRTYLQDARIVQADIRELSARDLRPPGSSSAWRPSLLAGGPPCQPWSSAGLQKGFADSRGQLIGEMLRLADELRPRYVLMENVRGLLTAAGPRGTHGEAIQILQSEWENLGFAVSWGLVNAADYGAAQRRVRLVMIGTADHRLPAFPTPTHSEQPSLWQDGWVALGKALEDMPMQDQQDVVIPTGKRASEILALEPGSGLRTGGTVEHQRPGGHWGYRQDCFLADLCMPSRTIRAASTPDWIRVNGQTRRLTWRECAVLQGFPTRWDFAGTREAKFRLIGNAVQSNVAEALGRAVFDGLAAGRIRTRPVSAPWPAYFGRRIRGAAADHRANAATRGRLELYRSA